MLGESNIRSFNDQLIVTISFQYLLAGNHHMQVNKKIK